MAFSVFRRYLITRIPALRYSSRGPGSRPDPKNIQIGYVRSLTEEDIDDWKSVKKFILKNPGSMNDKNINGVMMKTLLTANKIDIASSFVEYIHKNEKDLSLGTINALLEYYSRIQYNRALTEQEKKFILDNYHNLYNKYKFLDYVTCERLLHALCAINEWNLALKVLEDIKQSAVPTHSAYNTVIATLFQNGKKKEALKIAEDSINNKRILTNKAYVEWINYILRNYRSKSSITEQMNEMLMQIKDSFTVVSLQTANSIVETFSDLGWIAKFSKIRKSNGQCVYCKSNLSCLSATDEEFTYLQQTIREKLIIGSDLFLKSSPEELQRFQDLIKAQAPFDIVLDALNIAFASQSSFGSSKLRILTHVIDHFLDQNKKVLVLGRKHMLNWNKTDLNRIMRKCSCFFIDDLSQDDPYMISAAILSGPDTDIVSKDLFRGHLYNLKEDKLRNIFRRWQWQHQWMVFMGRGGMHIQAPLSFTPCTQFNGSSWHLPYLSKEGFSNSHVNDGIPDLRSWLCITKR